MFTKKLLVVVATALVGLTMGVGCGSADDAEATGQSEDALRRPGDVVAAEPQQAAPPAEAAQAKPSPVTCSGDQNHGGRICCDATHCCINILGVINCHLPAPTRK